MRLFSSVWYQDTKSPCILVFPKTCQSEYNFCCCYCCCFN